MCCVADGPCTPKSVDGKSLLVKAGDKLAKGYLIDLDGVVWKEKHSGRWELEMFKGAARAINRLRSLGKKIVFITNTHLSTDEIVKELAANGVPCSREEVACSMHAAALYIRKKYGKSRVFVIGQGSGLLKELQKQGHRIVKRNADVALVGFDREFSYKKLDDAYAELQKGARFVATNPNVHYLCGNRLAPGAGALAAALSAASGMKPFFAGKPSKFIGRLALKKIGLKASECVLVGDSIEDMRMARGIGSKAVIVLTGVFSRKQAERCRPDYIKKSITELNGNE